MNRDSGFGDFEPAPTTARVLLVTSYDWFAASFEAVLRPENFAVVRVRSARDAVRELTVFEPSLVVIDEDLVDATPDTLIQFLREAGLAASVPIVVYSPSFWRDGMQANSVQMGAWDVLREPIRPHLLVSKFRRLLQIKELIDEYEHAALADMATGLLNLEGLVRMLRVVSSAAERSGAALSCAVIGLPATGSADAKATTRRKVADHVQRNLRRSDACGWLSDSELGVLAFGADAAGVTILVRRIESLSRSEPLGELLSPIRVGIASLTSSGSGPAPSGRAPGEAAGLARLELAREALRSAETAGGGIRIADTDG